MLSILIFGCSNNLRAVARALPASSFCPLGSAGNHQVLNSTNNQARSSFSLSWLEEAEQLPEKLRKKVVRERVELELEAVNKEKKIAVQDKELQMKDMQLEMVNKEKELALQEVQLMLERERNKAAVTRLLAASGKLHMRGVVEYVFRTPRQDPESKNLRPVEIWHTILQENKGLKECIVKATAWSDEDVPRQLTQLYSHLSTHIHSHFQFSVSEVDILDSVVNPAQADALVCICDAYRIAYRRHELP